MNEYVTGEERLPSDQKKKKIEQAKFTYSPLRKAFEKETKIFENQEEKQVKAIEDSEN